MSARAVGCYVFALGFSKYVTLYCRAINDLPYDIHDTFPDKRKDRYRSSGCLRAKSLIHQRANFLILSHLFSPSPIRHDSTNSNIDFHKFFSCPTPFLPSLFLSSLLPFPGIGQHSRTKLDHWKIRRDLPLSSSLFFFFLVLFGNLSALVTTKNTMDLRGFFFSLLFSLSKKKYEDYW